MAPSPEQLGTNPGCMSIFKRFIPNFGEHRPENDRRTIIKDLQKQTIQRLNELHKILVENSEKSRMRVDKMNNPGYDLVINIPVERLQVNEETQWDLGDLITYTNKVPNTNKIRYSEKTGKKKTEILIRRDEFQIFRNQQEWSHYWEITIFGSREYPTKIVIIHSSAQNKYFQDINIEDLESVRNNYAELKQNIIDIQNQIARGGFAPAGPRLLSTIP